MFCIPVVFCIPDGGVASSFADSECSYKNFWTIGIFDVISVELVVYRRFKSRSLACLDSFVMPTVAFLS